MNKNKHLILDDRRKIQLMLNDKESFAAITAELGKDPTTISREIRSHLQYRLMSVMAVEKGVPAALRSAFMRLTLHIGNTNARLSPGAQ